MIYPESFIKIRVGLGIEKLFPSWGLGAEGWGLGWGWVFFTFKDWFLPINITMFSCIMMLFQVFPPFQVIFPYFTSQLYNLRSLPPEGV